MIKIAAMGDNVVDCYLSMRTMFPGGNCLNVSVYTRRLGAVSAYIGAIGRDSAGKALENALAAEGVLTDRLRVLSGPTAYCIIGHRGADRVFLRADLGVSMFEPDEGDLDYLTGFDAVHVGQSSGLDGFTDEIRQATRLSYDFSTRSSIEHFRRIGPHCYLASASAGERDRAHAIELVNALLAAGAQWVLVTRGREGAMLASRTQFFEVSAAPVSPLDTLGAGDTFIARTLYGLLNREEPQTTLEAAAKAAAETCLYYGAIGHGVPLELSGRVPELDGVPASTDRHGPLAPS